MSETIAEAGLSNPGSEEALSALFANLVMKQTNMALMLLGKVAHPETGKTVVDLDSARMLIDQLEMLEAKTKGNLSKDETTFLKQSLMTLRLTFVQAVESSPAQSEAPVEHTESAPPPAQTAPDSALQSSATQEEEHRKKFSKKY